MELAIIDGVGYGDCEFRTTSILVLFSPSGLSSFTLEYGETILWDMNMQILGHLSLATTIGHRQRSHR